MRSSQAPRAATWLLLKSLTSRDKSEALLGDLLEEFVRGRSASWYWHQVLAAIIVSFGEELRRRWIAIGFAALWTAVVVLSLKHIYASSHIRHWFNAVFGWTAGVPFPMSVIYVATFTLSVLVALQTTAGVIGLGIYLLTTRSFTLRGLLRTASVALAIVFIGNIVVAAMVMSAVSAHHVRVVASILESTLVFVSLLVAVWTPSVENSSAKSISA